MGFDMWFFRESLLRFAASCVKNLEPALQFGRRSCARVERGRWSSAGLSVAVGALLCSSCLVPSPPVFDELPPERPNLRVDLAVPAANQILVVQKDSPATAFTVEFESVDAGQSVAWVLWLNWGLNGETFTRPKGALEPGSDGQPRELRFNWSVPSNLAPGCQLLTLFVTHASNISFETDRPKDLSKTAMVTWWVNVEPSFGEQQTLVDCPLPITGSELSPDLEGEPLLE